MMATSMSVEYVELNDFAGVSIVSRCSSLRKPSGSVTCPLVVSGSVANAGAPPTSIATIMMAVKPRRRIRDTVPPARR